MQKRRKRKKEEYVWLERVFPTKHASKACSSEPCNRYYKADDCRSQDGCAYWELGHYDHVKVRSFDELVVGRAAHRVNLYRDDFASTLVKLDRLKPEARVGRLVLFLYQGLAAGVLYGKVIAYPLSRQPLVVEKADAELNVLSRLNRCFLF